MPGSDRRRPGERPAPRLAFLDGLRGIAALYVVLHHAALMVPPRGLSATATAARSLLRHGHYAVAVFIVLSGYCLMLPVARDPDGGLPGGLLAYLGRRARRILPPYYAALALSWALIGLVPALGRPDGARWDRALPAGGIGVVASHLLLAHNLDGRWIDKVDPPMWSVATEWQIYLLFPALLALWRRRGIASAVAAGFALGYVVAALATPLGSPALRQLCPWYAGLFAIGMAGAVASCGPRPTADGPAPGGLLATGLGVVALVAATSVSAGLSNPFVMAADPLVGAATAGLIVRWARRTDPGSEAPRPFVLRLLEDRRAVALGSISYSLYLVHYPLLALADATLRARAWGPEARLAALLLVASPLCIVVAALFRAAFERPGRVPIDPARWAIAERGRARSRPPSTASILPAIRPLAAPPARGPGDAVTLVPDPAIDRRQ
jgi:peptidoglycan/LPS O-acetylase OafA/YrhL